MRVGVMEQGKAPAARATSHQLAGEAFEVWVSRSRDTLYATLLRILRDETEAEDILQETYLRALSRLRSFRGEGDPIGWLRRIAVRLALNRLRAKRLRRWLPLTVGDDGPERIDALLPELETLIGSGLITVEKIRSDYGVVIEQQ